MIAKPRDVYIFLVRLIPSAMVRFDLLFTCPIVWDFKSRDTVNKNINPWT